MKVIIGGTFNNLHDGHIALFDNACEIGKIILVGITSDEMAHKDRPSGTIKKFSTRKKVLKKYLYNNYSGVKFEFSKITEVYNRALTREVGADVIVASEGKKKVIEKINKIRVKNNLKPLKPALVPYVLAEDCTPIKSTRIANGEMDLHGKMLRPIVIYVGSGNKVKIKAVKTVFNRIFPKGKIIVKGFEVKSGVDDQPFGNDTIIGAINRAKAVCKISERKGKNVQDPDFCVGIEAGLIWKGKLRYYFDVQYCAVMDKMGKLTIGHGSGFQYPDKVIAEVKKGRSIGDAMEDLTGIDNIGSKKGAIGFLTKNLLDRTSLTEQAVLMAMVPRIRKKFFGK